MPVVGRAAVDYSSKQYGVVYCTVRVLQYIQYSTTTVVAAITSY